MAIDLGSFAWPNFGGGSTITIGSPANGLSITGSVLTIGLASTSTTGALSSTDWNTFNNKQSTLTLGNLTEAGTDGITVTGGTGAVVGSGTSISQHVADTTHNGYLSSTDWNTFNGKQASGSYITALTGDVTASGPGSAAATLTATSNATLVTLSGLTTASSLASIGTITTGVWNGTTIVVAHGGTGNATAGAGTVLNGTNNTTAGYTATPTLGVNGTTTGQIVLSNGAGSGAAVLIQNNANVTSQYNFNLPATAGTSGQYLTSAAGGSSAMTWTTPPPTISLRYYSSTTTITSSSATITYSTQDYDTDSAYSSGTFTVPTGKGGKYQINAALLTTATNALNDSATIVILKNGTSISRRMGISGGAQTDIPVAISDIINLADGDTIIIQANASGTGPSIISSTTQNYLSIIRVSA